MRVFESLPQSVRQRRTGFAFAVAWHARAVTLARALAFMAVPMALMGVSTEAIAQEASSQDIAQARQLGQQAQAAYDTANYTESEKLWFAASKLYAQAPTLTLGLARAQAKLGKFFAAQESYAKLIREWSSNATAPQPFKDAVEVAKSEVVTVSAKVASVTLSIDGPAATSASVTLDGQPVPSFALGLKRPVDPGFHKVAATADGYKPLETTFSVSEGGAAIVALKMDKPGAPLAGITVVAPGPTLRPRPDAKDKRSSNKTLALVAFGVGGAGLLVGGVAGVIALGKASDLKSKCDADKACPSGEQDNVDSYKSMGTLSTIGFVVAGVGAVAGAVLWFTAPKEREAVAATARRYTTFSSRGITVSPYFGGTAAGVSGGF